jgi:alpha-L-fucosidase
MDSINKTRDMSKYRAYMKNQVTELLTNYGEISLMWFDFSYAEKGNAAWDSENLLKLARKSQPKIMVNNRLDLNKVEGELVLALPVNKPNVEIAVVELILK